MRKRKLIPVAEMPLVGGAVCLDFANTTGARASQEPRERLHTYSDLLMWASRVGILDDTRAEANAERARTHPRQARAALDRARELREVLYAVFRPLADGGEPSPAALSALVAWWRLDTAHRTLVSRSGVFEIGLEVRDDALDAMVWPVVSSAVALLTTNRLAKLKRCGECDWLFLDETKNGTRTWCKKACGDRVRARRHYHGTR